MLGAEYLLVLHGALITMKARARPQPDEAPPPGPIHQEYGIAFVK